MKRILVVVDMQNDFVKGALGSKAAEAIVDGVARKVQGFDGRVYATLDTHGDDYLITQEGRRLPVPHCIKDTLGWCIVSEVAKALPADARIIEKNGFGSELLPRIIREELGGVDEVTLVGLCTDICVITNAFILKTAFPEARIVVESGLCAGVTPESHKTALEAMRACQIDID